MNLLRAEWSRLFARRFTKIMMLVVLLAIVAVGIGYASASHPHDAATLAAATAEANQIHEEEQAQERACEAARTGTTAADEAQRKRYPPGFSCSQITAHTPDPEELMPDQFVFRTDASSTVDLLAFLIALFGFAVGASFIGAEWSSAGLMNLLLWRPRRLPLLAGKLTTLLAGVLVTGVVASAAWFGMLWAVATTRGDTSGVTTGVLNSLALSDARALALALAAAAIGFCVASIGRHTATALGIVVGYAVLFEIGLRIVLDGTHVKHPQRWELSNYVAAWLDKGRHYVDYPPCTGFAGDCTPDKWSISMSQGTLVCGVLLAVVVVGAFLSFRRRDI